MPTGISQPLAYTFPVLSLPVTSSTYFIYRIELSIVSHEIVTQLYCAATIKSRWSNVQDSMQRIDRRLVAWRDKLPSEFDITFEDSWTAPDWTDPNILSRMGLAMQFSSARMILFRACLCRFEGRLKHQPESSKDFNQEAVETCIRSARKMISLLSWSASSSEKLYAISPWWNTLHYICEALSVLMLELAFKATHMPDEAAYLLDDAKKGIRWLAMMAEQSVSARKAWEIFDSLIRLVAPMIRWSVFDLPIQAPVPPGYNWRRFNAPPFTSPPPPSQPQPEPPPPQQQLSESNLQQYSAAQPAATTGWPGSQSFSFAPQPSFAPAHAFEQASNPLDHSTALQRFSHIGQVHGHYDDPWEHFFNLSEADAPPTFPATVQDIMQGQLGPGMGDQRRYPEPPGFGGVSAFGTYGGGTSGSFGGYGSAEGSSGGSSGPSRPFF
jgi:hypothetical protein